MRERTRDVIICVPLAALLLLCALPAAHAASGPVPLSLTLAGSIDDSGQQVYSQGGASLLCDSCFALIQGVPVDPTTAVFTESVSATTVGTTTTGTATFSLSGDLLNGSSFSIGGPMELSPSSIPAEAFPVTCWDGVTLPLPSGCQGAVPLFFVGGGTFDASMTTESVTTTSSLTLGMTLESAFINPFGDAIVWASTDAASSLVFVFNYTSASIDWSGVHVSGTFTGTLGTTPSTPASGMFNETTTAHEDLFAGTETETGTMTFYDATPVGLDTTGTYSGSSTIPTAGEIDCSSIVTGIPGTCTETGFSSSGTFSLDPVTVSVVGGYTLQWAVPALTFTGTASGTATPSGGGIPGVPQFGSLGVVPLALVAPLLFLLRKRARRPRPLG